MLSEIGDAMDSPGITMSGYAPTSKFFKRTFNKSHSSEHISMRSNYDSLHGNTKKRKRKRRSKSQRMKNMLDHKNKAYVKETVSLLNQHHNKERLHSTQNVISKSGPHSVPSATVTHLGQSSLMNKLITAGLAKKQSSSGLNTLQKPLTISVDSDSDAISNNMPIEVIDKKEIPLLAQEINEDDDSEIEVIIPPKKLPTVVTLDSDGEELEESIRDNPVDKLNLTEPVEKINEIVHKSDDKEAMSKDSFSDNASAKCLDSDFEVLYSPSSPSSCNSLEESRKKDFELSPVISYPSLEIDENCSNNSQGVNSATTGQNISLIPMSEVMCSSQDAVQDEVLYPPNNGTEEVISKPCCTDKVLNEGKENSLPSTEENSKKDCISDISAICKVPFQKNKLDVLTDSSVFSNKPNKSIEECKFVSNNCDSEHISSTKDFHKNTISYELNEPISLSSFNEVVNNISLQDSEISDSQDINVCYSNQTLTKESTFPSADVALINDGKIRIDQNVEFPEESSSTISNHIEGNAEETLDLTDEQEAYSPLSNYGDIYPLNTDQTKVQDKDITNISTTTKSNKNLSENINNVETKENESDGEVRTFLHIDTEENESDTNIAKNQQTDDEDDISKLRLIALSTKGKSNQNSNTSKEKNLIETIAESNTSADDDYENEEEEVLQLRVAALKSAVIKKHEERKKRGLFVKKRNQNNFGNADDFILSGLSGHEDQLNENKIITSEKNKIDSPTSPHSIQGEDDMDIDSDTIDNKEEDVPQMMDYNVNKLPMLSCDTTQDILLNTYMIPSTPLIPPQPLPPGVDIAYSTGCFNESQSQKLSPLTQFPPVLPPPPPPPALVLHSLLAPPPPPPPPPPPSDITRLDTCLPQQSEVSSGSFPSVTRTDTTQTLSSFGCAYSTEKTIAAVDYSDDSVEKNKVLNSSSEPFLQPNLESSFQSSNKNGNQLRQNLRTIPVLKNLPKRIQLKKSLQKVRKRGKKVNLSNKSKTLIPQLLCITNTPVSFESKNKIHFKSQIQCSVTPMCSTETLSNKETKPITNREQDYTIPLCTIDPSLGGKGSGTRHIDPKEDSFTEEIYRESNKTNSNEKIADSHSLEDNRFNLDDEMDLSNMIVLDEVGPESPECKTRLDANNEFSLPVEEEDEDTLRVQALTSLSKKTGPKTPSNTRTLPLKQPKKYESPHYYENRENYIRRELQSTKKVIPRGKDKKFKNISVTRRLNVNDPSRYRLTRIVSNEPKRNVIKEKESLKVVIPPPTPQFSLLAEPSPPMVGRFVINVGPDSDSEEDVEWLRRVHIQDKPVPPPQDNPVPPPQVNVDLERSIDLLLMNARQKAGKAQHPSVKPDMAKRVVLRPNSSLTPHSKEEQGADLLDTPLRLLPKEKQEEYQRLKKIIEEREELGGKGRLKIITETKNMKNSYSPLQSVLRNETSKRKQNISNSDHQITEVKSRLTLSDSSDDSMDILNGKGGKSNSILLPSHSCKINDKTKEELVQRCVLQGDNYNHKENKSTIAQATNNSFTDMNDHSANKNQIGPKNIKKLLESKQETLLQFSTKIKKFFLNIVEECSDKNSDNEFPKHSDKDKIQIESNSVSSTNQHELNAMVTDERSRNNPCKPLIGVEYKNTERSPCEMQNKLTNSLIDNTGINYCNDESLEVSKSSQLKNMHLEGSTPPPYENNKGNSLEVLETQILGQKGNVEVISHNTLDSVKTHDLKHSSIDKEIEKEDNEILSQPNLGIHLDTSSSDREGSKTFEDQTLNKELSLEEINIMKNEECSDNLNTSLLKKVYQKSKISGEQKQSVNDSEVLASNQSEMVNERYVLIDELTEMLESLAYLEKEMLQLGNAMADVRRLRRELQEAETRLSNLHAETGELENSVCTAHQAMTTRHSHIQRLESTCLRLGRQLVGPDYQMPISGNELLERKMKLVIERRKRISDKRKEIKEKHSTQKETAPIHSRCMEQNNGGVWRDFPLVSPSSVTSSSTSVNISSAHQVLSLSQRVEGSSENNSSEKETILSKVSDNPDILVSHRTSSPTDSRVMQWNPPVNIPTPENSVLDRTSLEDKQNSFTTIENSNDRSSQIQQKMLSAPNSGLSQKCDVAKIIKRSFSEVSSDSNSISCGEKKRNIDQTPCNQSEGIIKTPPLCETKNSKISNKKSIRSNSLLRYRSSINRAKSMTISSTEAILCPFDLSGKCQDTQCPYLHPPATFGGQREVAERGSNPAVILCQNKVRLRSCT